MIIPQLITSGTRDDRPHIITKLVPGLSFVQVYTKINLSDRHALTTLLGHTLHYLHQIPIDKQPILSQMRNEFTEFIEKQEQKCVKRHRRWHTFPEHLIDQIPTYLHDHDRLNPLSLIHGHISCDHILVIYDSEYQHWQTTGLIDFGDAWVGDPAYELVALHCTLFNLDTSLLQTFLQAYQLFEESIIERAMVAMFLFEFNIFKTVAIHRPDTLCTVVTLQELAQTIWAIEDI